MIAHATNLPQQRHLRPDLFHATSNLVNGREYATLIVDGLGTICGCGAAAQDIFGASQSRLIGRRISAFIAGIFDEESSPSRNAIYLAHLCADRDWRQFDATDACGRGFRVETTFSRMMADDREVFVINLRRPGDTN